ncbi:hypothetical protein ACWD0J_30915, partial [Streptomyces sp. NPDC003011]
MSGRAAGDVDGRNGPPGRFALTRPVRAGEPAVHGAALATVGGTASRLVGGARPAPAAGRPLAGGTR